MGKEIEGQRGRDMGRAAWTGQHGNGRVGGRQSNTRDNLSVTWTGVRGEKRSRVFEKDSGSKRAERADGWRHADNAALWAEQARRDWTAEGGPGR